MACRARCETASTKGARPSAITMRSSGSSPRRTTCAISAKRPPMWLLAAASFAAAGGIHYQTPMLGAMASDFGADSAAIGWVPTLTFGGFLAGILLLVPLGDRLDQPRLILTQHFAAIVALLAAAAAPGLATVALAGFFIGVCACYAQTIVPLVAELAAPNQRGRDVGTLLSALFLGILFGRIGGGLRSRPRG